MKDNKGMTVVEILISVVIISLSLTLLFSLLIQVRNEENNTNIQSNFKLTQASFIRLIEEDIVNYGVKAITSCELSTAKINQVDLPPEHTTDFKCIKIHYAADYLKDNIGFIIIHYQYKNYKKENGKIVGDQAIWSLSYQRGSYKTCKNYSPVYTTWDFATNQGRELPSEVDLSDTPYVLYTASAGNNAASLVLPIVNADGEHYDLNLSFTFKGYNDFVCSPDSRLECKCMSSNTTNCNNTLYKTGDSSNIALRNKEALDQHICPTA